MKAIVLQEPGRFALEELPVPRAEDGHVVVRVRAVGICGSDLHAYNGAQPFFEYPQVPGHEICGIVHELPGRAGDLQPGDHVVIDPTIPCGRCYACGIGRYNCCPNLRVIGVHTSGGLAEFVSVPQQNVYSLPHDIPFEVGALVEPLAVGVQANERGRISEGETVVIIGAGMIGLAVLMVARARGARTLIADMRAARLEKAVQIRADAVVDVREADLADEVRDFTGGEGANVVVEAVGSVETVRSALDLVSPGGRIVILGLCPDSVPLPVTLLVRKETELIASRLNAGRFPDVIGMLIDGRLAPAPVITHRVSLEEVDPTFRMLSAPDSSAVKAIVEL